MAKIVIVVFLSIFSFANPYENITVDEKLTLLTNYFLNEAIQNKLPKQPIKETPKEQDYNYKPTKYELYYNYVQRIKAIRESIVEEQKKIDEKYKADVYRYNHQIELIHKKYQQYHNLYPIIQNSFNKALKVIYGKPILELKNGKYGQQFFLKTRAIYDEYDFKEKAIVFNHAEEKKMFYFYEKCELNVTFEYNQEEVLYDEVICRYNQNEYIGKIEKEDNEKIKLKVKINDDIFQKIKIEDIK